MLQHTLGGMAVGQGRRHAQQDDVSIGRTAQSAPGAPAFDITDDTMRAIFQELAHALTVLSSAADLMLANKHGGPSAPGLHVWLRPNARQAEDAMHRLRERRLGPSAAMTELSQCLTILILAADMICAGQLSEVDANECYELLRRNADRAVAGLYELHSQLNAGPQAS